MIQWHEHYDAEVDKRWACCASPCLLPDAAPPPGPLPLPVPSRLTEPPEIEPWRAASGPTFAGELTSLLNRYTQETASDTPDWILAQYLLGCLAAWNQGIQHREQWYGRAVGEGRAILGGPR
jgi:hypothetical protein